MSMRSSQHLPCESLKLNRSAVGTTANSLVYARRQQLTPLPCGARPGSTPPFNPVFYPTSQTLCPPGLATCVLVYTKTSQLPLITGFMKSPLEMWVKDSLEPRRSAVLISALATGPPAGVGGGLGPFLAA